MARQINTAEAQAKATSQRYASLATLTGVSMPEGFDAQISTDGATYTFSVRDVQDSCRAAVFQTKRA